jgi:hypothetical protein
MVGKLLVLVVLVSVIQGLDWKIYACKKISEPLKSEIEEYLSDALDEVSLDDEFDILVWWKLKTQKLFLLG